MNSAATAQQLWQQHVTRAVRAFLKTAVVIDNQPSLETCAESIEQPKQSDGTGEEVQILEVPESFGVDESANILDVRSITDSFINHGISCAFLMPEDSVGDNASKIERALKAAKISDVVVIDWFLQGTDTSLTLQILEQISKSDVEEKGRLRLVCVYTGQVLNEQIFADILAAFNRGGISLRQPDTSIHCAFANNTVVILLNKVDVPSNELPNHIIGAFTRLADGIIPSFALAAVGAIRNNTHHMLTRFNSLLDAAYVSNRLITNPPGDVAELIRNLLVAECDNALGLDSIADDYLEQETIIRWLDVSQDKFAAVSYDEKIEGKKAKINLDIDHLKGMLRFGVGDKSFSLDGRGTIPFPEYKRAKVSEVLAGGASQSKVTQNEFSKLVILRREAYGPTTRLLNPSWRPSLTTGTLLKIVESEVAKYLMCFTPACDALRIDGIRPFVFLEGVQTDEQYNLVITESDSSIVGIYFDKKYPVVRTISFLSDSATQRVRAQRSEDNKKFEFISLDNNIKCEWMGEVSYSRASSEMASLASIWMRIGIVDSEYLRLAAKGHVKFT